MFIVKYIFLLVAIIYTFSNIVKAFYGKAIGTSNIVLMAIGIVGYLIFEFELGF